MKRLSLQEVLEGIEDTRRERSIWYPLNEVLFIMLTAVIWGATSYTKVEMFGKSKEDRLKKYIKLENGIPDACTFRNIIKAIDTEQLHTAFVEWMQGIVENVTGVVAIDGKQARRTRDAKKHPLHVVSAFSAECGLVLGQLACEEKSNEIKQCKVAKKITEKGADYILGLKENQKTLYEDVRLYFEEYRRNPAGLDSDCCATSRSQGHGRYENRARADHSAENLNIPRHWAYNLLKSNTSVCGSFSDKQFKCLLDESFLDKIVCSAFTS